MNPSYPSIKQALFLLFCIVTIQTIIGVFITGLLQALNHEINNSALAGFADTITLGLIIFNAQKYYEYSFSKLYSFKLFNPLYLIPIILVTCGFSILLSELNNVIQFFVPIPPMWREIFTSVGSTKSGMIPSILTLSIIAPLTEELLFQGLFLKSFLTKMTKSNAIVLSSLLFAILHLNLWQFAGAFLMGILLANMYIEFKSLLPCLIVHSIYNFLPTLSRDILSINISGYSSHTQSSQFQTIRLT